MIEFCCFEGEEPQINQQPILELQDASKSYGAVRALRDGNLALRSGEVRALMGENGAGKSTLVKVLGGVVRRDAGEMLVDGESVDFHSPHDARDAGIAVIYQEPTLFPDLSVADPGYLTNGSFRLQEPLRVQITPAPWTGPVSNAAVTIAFQQHIGRTEPLRTGTYSRTLTFTLSTTNP